MKLNWLSPSTLGDGPVVSVTLDASRLDESGAHEVDLRWQAQQRSLLDVGAPESMVQAAGAAVLAPTGHGGSLGKLVVAGSEGVLLDLVLPHPPVRDEATYGPAPYLLPAVRSLSRAASYVLARVDRTGADIEVVGMLGDADEQQVDGDHDVLHKVPGGGWSQRRYRARVQDSWERNAAEVAHELDTIVARHKPELVLIAGDPQAVSALLEHAGGDLRSRIVQLDTGGRAEGTSAEAEQQAIEDAVFAHRTADRRELLDRFSSALAREQEAVDGLDAVIEVLRRGQVDELLLHDDPSAAHTLWVGADPLLFGRTAEDAREAGAQDAREERVDAVLLGALLATDAGITLLNPTDIELADGIGALLRWSDRATPHSHTASMPGHGEAPHQGHRG